MVKRLPTMWETQVRSLGWENPLEKEMATHSSTLAWKIPWMEETGRLQSMGLQRVRHNWATSLSLCGGVCSNSCPLSRWCHPTIIHPLSSPSPPAFSLSQHQSLLQCMKVKSESEVTQSCLALSDPMDCSPPGSSVHGIFQARVLEWGAMAFSVYDQPVLLKKFC